ncbi:uncharacterized protein LACBIDRAFT_313079 [Laccaria bicolor S238N-H82]|uniref:Predicted protein n=1 Tax=Laccaria bicolor (strain S238N-H82 / ATCC MYA-4686) TaxID=486041 RepID=B0DXH2_LACBS|nr:uncharacterized protein LACBIDRAFT_313079 [Laccaria bicolor S238N-H82]EDR00618.1 predicted protein [Laccaria bicolor S238N-H82]|eukprot:XP_001888627.1 predicted protein [Laccaria bicolor S238N-H82]
MDEPPSRLLKSRIPRKTILYPFRYSSKYNINDPHCPLRKGIICYHRHGTIFEHNIHSSGKHEPRIIVPSYTSWSLRNMSFVPVKGNRILLLAKYWDWALNWDIKSSYLHLSIHEIRSDLRVGPEALWSFNGSVDGRFDIRHLELIKSTENELGITFWVRFVDHWKLFNISTSETDTSNNFPLIESGRIGFDPKFKLWSLYDEPPFILSPDTRILLNMDVETGRDNETIDIHYLDLGAANFSFVTRMSIPCLAVREGGVQIPELAFSADGSKFAMGMPLDGVSVWNIRSKVPLWTFTEPPQPKAIRQHLRYPQFSSGNLGKKILVFVEWSESLAR